MKTNFALIGNGFIGKKGKEAMGVVGGNIIAVCDIDETKGMGGVPFYTDYREAMKNADIVSIATPNDTHAEIALYAARLGKKIICEKPVTFKMEEIDLMSKIPNLYGVFQLRKLPEINEMRIAAKSAHTAELKIEMKRSGKYYDGWKGDVNRTGGLLVNIGTHYMDLVGHLFGYDNFYPENEVLDELCSRGVIKYENKEVRWSIELTEEKPTYERCMTIGNKKFDLVQKENLHIKIYEDAMWNHGTTVDEEKKILGMIQKIKNANTV